MEKMENIARQARLKGSSVEYGDCIQFQHTLTKKYVCVFSTQSSVTESSKLMVCYKILIYLISGKIFSFK